ncbi:DMT family transporter [Marinobacter lacisalsi]|uniref:DMT family transporter n=1 Tax=Marinobacter lacisalsi TaxID=475979 RepID=A0ABV8QLH3_9GAMM
MVKGSPDFDTRSVLVVLAAICWGLAGGLGGWLMADGWDPYVLAFYRGATGLVCIALWVGLRPVTTDFTNPRLWFWSVVAGLGVAGNFTFYFLSISKGSVAVAATLMYCAPVFVYILSFILKLERLTPLKGVAILLVTLGIVLLTRVYNVGETSITTMGVVAGLLAGLSYAIFIFGFKYATPHGSPQSILVMAFGTLCISLMGLVDFDQALAALSSSDLPLFMALGLLGAGVSFVMYVVGLDHTAPAVASVVAMVEPVTASLFGVFILDERLAGMQVAGMVLILVTVTVLSVASASGDTQS